MRKNIKYALVPAFLVALMVAVWIVIPASVISGNKRFNELVASAEDYESRKMHVDALECYLEALALHSGDYDVCLKTAELYGSLENYASFVQQCKLAIGIDPGRSAAYAMLIEYYISVSDHSSALNVIWNAEKNQAADYRIGCMKKELEHTYSEIWVSLSYAGDWVKYGDEYLAPAGIDGKYGLISSSGKKKLKFKFDAVGAPDSESGLIPVKLDGEWYYADMNGNRRLASNTGYSYLGGFSSGLAPAEKGDLWGYIDRSFSESHFEFEYAGAFSGGVAAVKKDGKWALISDSFVSLTGFIYDDILVDSNGVAFAFGLAAGKRDGHYFFIDENGKESAKGYDGVKLPASSDGAVAVMEKGKWSFTEGNVSLPEGVSFDDAFSFSCGMCAVKSGDEWFFIDETGTPVSSEKEKMLFPFSPDGAAFVFNGYTYNILKLSAITN